MTVSEKVAYLKGLIDGMGFDADSKNGKLFHAISDILEDLAGDVHELRDSSLEMAEDIDALTDDLADVEDFIYGEDEGEDGRTAPGCGYCCGASEDEGNDEEEPVFFDVTCRSCGKTITVDEDIFDLGTVQCPNCGEMMFFGEEDDEPDDADVQPADE